MLLDLQLEQWIARVLNKDPAVHLIPLDRKQEQKLIVENQLRACADTNCYEEVQTRYVSCY